ncbi:uncharacterized protein LOC113558374 [Rhopalosiphum maidis]|uniref:uncharacterized protein LOC113558374 n=1 Tax=Rhopalosiphum maidis TaxID=43146 RepID=UPI000EFF5619|nr:uncharacterized protein LOC113558374 [Rhopalosiphum maidis]
MVIFGISIYTRVKEVTVETNLEGRVVKNLTNPLHHKNHNLYIDKFFKSVPLLAYLKSKRIFCCGTVKSTRKYLPKLELDKNMIMGDIDWNMSDVILHFNCQMERQTRSHFAVQLS